MALTPAERRLRAKIAAHALHASGGTNVRPAHAAFLAKFEREVDPDGSLPPDERERRAKHALAAYMTRLALRSRRKAGTR